jgi:hypothetical protein
MVRRRGGGVCVCIDRRMAAKADRPGSPRMGWEWDPGDWYLEERRSTAAATVTRVGRRPG